MNSGLSRAFISRRSDLRVHAFERFRHLLTKSPSGRAFGIRIGHCFYDGLTQKRSTYFWYSCGLVGFCGQSCKDAKGKKEGFPPIKSGRESPFCAYTDFSTAGIGSFGYAKKQNSLFHLRIPDCWDFRREPILWSRPLQLAALPSAAWKVWYAFSSA